jgi:hypothetical protein
MHTYGEPVPGTREDKSLEFHEIFKSDRLAP